MNKQKAIEVRIIFSSSHLIYFLAKITSYPLTFKYINLEVCGFVLSLRN